LSEPVPKSEQKTGGRAERVGVSPAHRAFFGRNSHGENQSVAYRERDRGEDRTADHRHCRDLDDDRKIVGMAHEAIARLFQPTARATRPRAQMRAEKTPPRLRMTR